MIRMPSAALAASAVLRLAESAALTANALCDAGTAMVAVMSTLAALSEMLTSDGSTPASSATADLRVCNATPHQHNRRSLAVTDKSPQLTFWPKACMAAEPDA